MDYIEHLYSQCIRLQKINPLGKKIINIKPQNKTIFFQYNFKNALDFLDAIDINKSELYSIDGNQIYSDYIFRGHEEHFHKLIPSAFRNLSQNQIRQYASGNGHYNNEINDFILFVKGMDNLGMYIHDDSYYLTNKVDELTFLKNNQSSKKPSIFDFPKDSQLQELALAQHQGIKTRLLDFTSNPLIALFFASKNARFFNSKGKKNRKKIGLWVIPKILIEAVNIEKNFVNLIEVKKYQNKNISAQKGVFLNYIPSASNNLNDSYSIFKDDTIKSLDALLMEEHKNNYLNKLIKEHIGKPMLFTLPYEEIDIISKRLEQLNINYLSLMPSLEGIKEEIMRIKKKL